MRNAGFDKVHEMDWGESCKFENSEKKSVEVHCTPCQHFSGRGILDRNQSLWASWVVESEGKKFFFGGDTGYRAVPKDLADDDIVGLEKFPKCPAFAEIGTRFGGFDLACIPIGAYSPRRFMSKVHANPYDAVEIHKDVKSRLSIGMHFGTFVLTDEPILEPPKLLRKACERSGISEDAFKIMNIGETISV